MRDTVRENLSLKIFSFLLAVFLWAYVRHTQADPLGTPETSSMTEDYITAVLKLENVSPDLMVVSAPKNVLINVRGSTEFVRNMGPGAVSAAVDLKDKPAGVYNLPVLPDKPPELALVQVDPERVNIELDSSSQQQTAIDLEPVGQPAAGFTVGTPVLQTRVATVEGPRSRVRLVHRVLARIDVNGLETDVVQRLGLEALDDAGNVVQDVALSPKDVVVTIPIRADVVTRTVTVDPDLRGDPPDGLQLDAAQVDPPLVTLMIPRGTQHPPVYVKTEPIVLKGLKHTTTVTSQLVVPDGMNLLREKSVHVTLKIIKRKEPAR